ncbi:MAG: hypothetical protein R3F41_08065 [Gammaproteobacteria bacterium]
MALLAEELVEEWLNRQGYFTIRGIRLGVDEIDLLAVKIHSNSEIECRHIEVQASMRPMSYISNVPKAAQKQGRAANSAKRSDEELNLGVEEWVAKKFRKNSKVQLMTQLAPAQWSSELVINNVKSEMEVDLIRRHGIKVLRLADIATELNNNEFPIKECIGG